MNMPANMVAVASATIERPSREPVASNMRTRILWPALILCAAAVAAVDGVFSQGFPAKLWVAAALDETAHAATALLAIACFAYAFERRFLVGVLIGSVLIDADHVPHRLGWDGLELPHTREFTHSLATVAAFLLLALLLRGRLRLVPLGIAAGLVWHLFRDLAEPAEDTPGVPLLWPLSHDGVKLPYAVYAAAVAALLLVALFRRLLWARKRAPE